MMREHGVQRFLGEPVIARGDQTRAVGLDEGIAVLGQTIEQGFEMLRQQTDADGGQDGLARAAEVAVGLFDQWGLQAVDARVVAL
jgi:hypothetical protein